MSNETKTPSVAGSEDDWETADFSNIAQSKPRQPSTTSDQGANLRPSAPTFQPRTSKPPTPRLWEPEPPVAPSESRLAGSGQVAGEKGTGTGTGRSVLLGPAFDVKGSTPLSTESTGRTRSTQEGDRRSSDQDRLNSLANPAQALPGMSPGSVIPGSSTGSTIRAPTILMRRDRDSVGTPSTTMSSTTPGQAGSSSSPFGDDDEWNRDPRSVVVPNSQLWEQANNSAPMPDLPKNAPAMPTAASLRILRRPSPATSASSSNFNQNHNNHQNEVTGSNGSAEALNDQNQSQRDGGFITRGSPGAGGNGSRSGSRRNKTLIEREEEYKRARERIFGTVEGAGAGVPGTAINAGPGVVENVPDNRSEVSGYDSGAATPARSGSSSTGSLASAATSAAPGPNTGTGTPQSQNPAQAQSRSGSVGPGSSTSSSSRIRTGPTQSSKRRGESHFEPLRPPPSGQVALPQGGAGSGVGGQTGSFLPSSTGGGMGYPRGATRDRFNASGYGPMGMYQTYEPAPYGMGLSGGMPYQGTALQQQQGQQGQQQQPGGYATYPQLSGYQPGQMQGQQPQLGMATGGQGGYGRMGSGGSMNGYQAGPMRQPIGPGDVEGMGFGQLRLNDAMPYGGGQGNQAYADGWQHGPPRPAYSSSSSSASSDVGSTGGYPHESMYRAGGIMPPPQQQMPQHPYASQPQPGMVYNNNKNNRNGSNNSHNGSNSNLSHMHGMEQPQPGYMGGRPGSGAYGQGWPASRQGSGGDASSDAGYPR